MMNNKAYRIFAVLLAAIILAVGIALFTTGSFERQSDITADDPNADDEPEADDEGAPPTAGPSPDPPEPEPPAGESDTGPPGEGSDENPEENPEPPADDAVYVRAKVDQLQVRKGPGTEHRSLGSLDEGDMVTLLAAEGNWYRTKYRNQIAYISADRRYTERYEIEKNRSEAVERVIRYGYDLLGSPYVYGATRYHDGSGKKLSGFDPAKYDCSSFVQYIFYRGASVLLPMTTRTQIARGRFVPRSAIARGDLLFFTNEQRQDHMGIERVGHVALYLGSNYILHTASDHAVIEQISAKRWSYYIEARRIL